MIESLTYHLELIGYVPRRVPRCRIALEHAVALLMTYHLELLELEPRRVPRCRIALVHAVAPWQMLL